MCTLACFTELQPTSRIPAMRSGRLWVFTCVLALACMLCAAGDVTAALNTAETGEGTVVSGGTLESGNFDAAGPLVFDSGSVQLGSAADGTAGISSEGRVTLRGGDISVITSGTKVSGALQMDSTNPKVPLVKPGTNNTFIPNDDPALKPALHSIRSGMDGMTLSGTSINLGAPRVAPGQSPAPADIARSWEGTRLDLFSAGDMQVQGGDFRVANIAFPIKREQDAALRFVSDGAITISGGLFTAEGQGVGNPVRGNYDAPSLFSILADKDLTVNGGSFDIKSARFHMNSVHGKVVINDGVFNIDNTSPYPAWQTYDRAGGVSTVRPPGANTQDKYGVFGSLDIASELVVNGGTFNVGSALSLPGFNYINIADKPAVFNGGTFNLYNYSNFGNNRAGMTINGGTYNMINGGYFGGRNTNGPGVDIRGGEFNFLGSSTIAVLTEAAYLENSAYNRTGIDISGGVFNFYNETPGVMDVGGAQASYALNISGGDFIRKADGLNSTTAKFAVTGQTGSQAATSGDMNISGGVFRTENPVNYARDVVVSRDDNIRLYDQNNPPGGPTYQMHTASSIEAVFAQGDAAVKAAFAPANNPDYLPTKAEVLAALDAANKIASARVQTAWDFDASGNINVTGGHFDFNTVNASRMRAGKQLVWDGGTLVASGGGGDVNLIGEEGIHIKSGVIASTGSADGKPFALKYDDRGRLNRDRWTLGGYLNFLSDGDIIIGGRGTEGPSIYYSEGMIGFSSVTSGNPTPGTMYLRSGSITLEGNYRSTLTVGDMATVIHGGTLNISTADRINRNKVDSASMWTFALTMNEGAINLHNAQVINAHEIAGGVVNMTGDSAITRSTGAMLLSGGTVNVGERSYIGAIKGDSLALSPYPTSNNGIDIRDGVTMNFAVKAPASPSGALTVGRDVGGIYSTESGADITIADGASFNFNVVQLDAGRYTAGDFVESAAGALNMNDQSMDRLFYSASITRQGADRADLVLDVKDNAKAFAALPGNRNVRDNAEAFRDMGRKADGALGATLGDLFGESDGQRAAEGFRQLANENSLGAMMASRGNIRLFGSQVAGAGSFLRSDLVPIADMRSKNAVASLENASLDPYSNSRLWATGLGYWGKQRDRGGITGFKTRAGGFALGYDYTTDSEFLRIGAALGYLDSNTESNDDLSEVDGDTWYGALYSSINIQPVVLDLGLVYGRTDNDLETKIRTPGISGKNSASFDSDSLMAYLNGSYPVYFNDGATTMAPFIGLEYVYVEQDGFTEKGALARKTGSVDEDVFTMPVGVRFKHEIMGDGFSVIPEAGIAYARDFNTFRPHVRTSYYTGSSLNAEGVDAGKDALRLDLGVSANIGANFSLFAKYNFEAREKYTGNQIAAGIKYTF